MFRKAYWSCSSLLDQCKNDSFLFRSFITMLFVHPGAIGSFTNFFLAQQFFEVPSHWDGLNIILMYSSLEPIGSCYIIIIWCQQIWGSWPQWVLFPLSRVVITLTSLINNSSLTRVLKPFVILKTYLINYAWLCQTACWHSKLACKINLVWGIMYNH